MFCKNCGKECSDNAIACPACGEPFKQAPAANEITKTTASLFAFFLGWIGIHDFILGKTGRGIGKIALWVSGCIIALPLFPLIIWVAIDLFHIASGTYPAADKVLTGDNGTAKALAITYVVLGSISIIVLIIAIAVLGVAVFGLLGSAASSAT